MSSIVDLDNATCSSDIIEALGYYSLDIIYRISRKNPYFKSVMEKYKIEIIREEGNKIYFRIRSTG
ncbi:hypothetical protein SUSAZ_04300 [Sulfolobus acidocaldarius SUSAZ]|nr:hypothetical protein SUSAZ_04300 [Sulfolobus acidocaldarius SUSAZ]